MPIPIIETQRGDYIISTDPTRLDVDAIHDFLAYRSYWSKGIPRNAVERSIQHSLCFGVYAGGQQAGFARVVSDYTTIAYIADVFILEDYRGRGLSKWLMECILTHPDLQNLKRWCLATRDAHGLYARYGFSPVRKPENWMELLDPEAIQRLAASDAESSHA